MRRPWILAMVIAAVAAASCGPAPSPTSPATPAASTAAPSAQGAVPASESPRPTPSASPSATPPPSTVASAVPSGSPTASAAPSPSPTPAGNFVVPPASSVHRFTCGGLVPVRTITALTRVPAQYFDFGKLPGFKPPALPKGETECKALGSKTSGRNLIAMTTTVIVFSGPSRATLDGAWSQLSGVGQPVPGVGDAALFDGASHAIVGYKGRYAFEIILEPFPLTLYATARVLAIDAALAKALVEHLG
jgi:hypothetical protein